MGKMCSAPIPLNTSAYVLLLASSLRKSENMVLAGEGMDRSRVCSTRELFTCVSTTGNGDAISTDPTTHAIRSTDATLTTAPPAESATVAECQVTVDRIAAPME